jgi:hypothetical protein
MAIFKIVARIEQKQKQCPAQWQIHKRIAVFLKQILYRVGIYINLTELS